MKQELASKAVFKLRNQQLLSTEMVKLMDAKVKTPKNGNLLL